MIRALAPRTYNVAYQAFGFTPSASLDQVLYVRAYSEINIYLPLKVQTEAAFSAHVFVHNSLLGLLAGIFIGIVLYNLFICISLRDRVYACYAVYEFGILLLTSMLSGQIHLIWPAAASAFAFDIRCLALTLVAISIAFALFIQEFAALKYNDAAANRLIMPFTYLHLDQLLRKTEGSRHIIIRGEPVHLTCAVAVFNLIDFSNQGFRVVSDTYVGRHVTLEIELSTFDGSTNAELAHLLLNKFYVEVRWSRKARTGGYEHGLKIAGLNDEQRDRIFNLVARLYAPADTELETTQGHPV